MDRQVRSKMNTQIYEEACAWFVECRAGDLDDTGRREFDRWLRKSPEHLSSYIEIAAIWNEGTSLDPGGKWSADTVIEQALKAGDDNVASLPGATFEATDTLKAVTVSVAAPEVASRAVSAPAPSSSVSVRPPELHRAWLTGWRRLAIAASIGVLAILAGALGLLEVSSSIYTTAMGEQRSIQFDDGSTVDLNSRSKIRVKYSKQERDVELIEGQALFHVAHDTDRPFIVSVGTTRVRAVGTQFDVYKKSTGTVVTVVEGRVAVYPASQNDLSGTGPKVLVPAQTPAISPGSLSLRKHSVAPSTPTSSAASSIASIAESQAAEPNALAVDSNSASSLFVAAGEQVTVTADAAQRIPNPNIAGVTAWRERVIVFESATLSDVAEEFNRYNQRQLVIEDPALYGFHISGVFSSSDPDALIKFLQQRPGVRVTETNGEIRVERDSVAMPNS
jgi:transmembrane sensor